MKKYWLKELVCFGWRNQYCVSIAPELCEVFNRRVLLNIFYRIFPTSYREKGRFHDTPLFCFFMEKHLQKKMLGFWWCDHDYASITAELCEEFNARVLLNIFFTEFLPTSSRERGPILWHTAILFLHGKAFTERCVRFLMVRSWLWVDYCRIMRGIQQKGSLKYLF